jgi:hypothetical protein
VVGTCCRHWRNDKLIIKKLVGKPEGKKPLGRQKHMCKSNIEIYHKKNKE